ncbi:hypothetical protein DO495_13695 [Salmonella enterica]|nr:hypothetical protein [Salmonella enterica]EBJ1456668.1 hypothetical protein [Salmonella enterica]EBN3399179.1 betaine/proline/choline family ABC transporter ATP-binding protein [Salmonella enterica subsp. enterica serovar Typhi]
MIKLENLTKQFVQKKGQPLKAVDNVNLNVPEGEMCVLLGPSGCGKTTTLKMINRLIAPSSGNILINGENTNDMDTVTLRRNIGYVIQQIGLFPNMTIEENITVVPRMLGWDKARCKQRAEELMDMVALDARKFLHRYPKEMSGGQQQRIGVIRALAADPPVLLMDEPFGAVDPINREVIQNQFLDMQRKLKKTVMLVSHDIDEALKLGDRIAVFRQGRIVQCASPDELLAKPANEFVGSFVGQDRTLKRLLLVSAGDVTDQQPTITARPSMPLSEAFGIMDDHDIRAITVIDNDGKPLGLMTASHNSFLRLKLSPPWQLALGGLIVGLLSLLTPTVWGNGYSVVQSFLLSPPLFSLIGGIFACKILAVLASSGSGAPGGVFTPTLFVGLSIGMFLGRIWGFWLPGSDEIAILLGLAGMATLLAATTHAPIMSTLMICEMTGEYQLLPGLLIACVVASVLSRTLRHDSIYRQHAAEH